MPFISNTDEEREEMLAAIGVKKFDELLKNIPEKFLLNKECCLERGKSELEIKRIISALAAKNISTTKANSFLGAGVYDHFIPAAVDHVIIKPEFHSAYTPYQAEVSQGTLQYIYEYQTLICELTGMEISNAGMYDGASAAAEAILMATRENGRKKAVLAGTINPNYLQVIKTYTTGVGLKLVVVKEKKGVIDLDDLREKVDEKTSCVVIQTPNFLGYIEEIRKIEKIAHSEPKALLISAVDPISLAILNSPKEYKADIVIGEGQALGNSQSYGGPLFGFMATNLKLARKMPGRIVGATKDAVGNRCYALTLQAREQHIRRSKATSNICSNQALCNLAATVYMCLMGRNGLKEAALQSTTKAHYLAARINEIEGVNLLTDRPFFKEFAIKFNQPVEDVINKLKKLKIFPGVNLTEYGYANTLLIAVTEKKRKQDLDELISALREVVNG
ncbi:MAG: glycine dehydrogenase [Candidatus Cloacimonas sp. SDB]|nr:MAG: glycine dehydrogenase [Candidatus Cloacimonas sp. SDB]